MVSKQTEAYLRAHAETEFLRSRFLNCSPTPAESFPLTVSPSVVVAVMRSDRFLHDVHARALVENYRERRVGTKARAVPGRALA